jgi:hypothetical protein
MAWGKTESKPEAESNAVVEFDLEGRTYRISVEPSAAKPHGFTAQMGGVSRETDLITNTTILVHWSRVGVLRIVENA